MGKIRTALSLIGIGVLIGAVIVVALVFGLKANLRAVNLGPLHFDVPSHQGKIPPSHGDVLFSDDFEEGLSGDLWSVLSGDIVVSDGKLSVAGNGEGTVEPNISLPSSYQIEMDLMPQDESNKGAVHIIFGPNFSLGVGGANWFVFLGDNYHWWAEWSKKENGEWEEVKSIRVNERTWGTLVVRVIDGRNFKVYKDGTELNNLFFPEAKIAQHVQVKLQGSMSIDNFVIRSLP